MPAAVSITRQDYTAAALRREAKRTDDADVARRMLALALVLEGKPRGDAAISCGMDRQILCDWVHPYGQNIHPRSNSLCWGENSLFLEKKFPVMPPKIPCSVA